MPNSPMLMSIADAARELGVSRWTISRLVDDGMLEKVKVRGRTMIVTQSVKTYVEKEQV